MRVRPRDITGARRLLREVFFAYINSPTDVDVKLELLTLMHEYESFSTPATLSRPSGRDSFSAEEGEAWPGNVPCSKP